MPAPMLVKLALASTTLFPPHTSTEERRKALAPFFDPAPGSVVTLSRKYVKNHDEKKHLYQMPGFITVTPPPGQCFVLATEAKARDKKVCHKQTLRFKLGDITVRGEIEWLVRTSPTDFGTKLTWHTPYRAGRKKHTVQGGRQKVDYFYVKGCSILKNSFGERLIEIHLFQEKGWQVRLPNQEKFILQPFSPRTTLYFQTTESKNIFAQDKKARREEAKRRLAAQNAIKSSVQELDERYLATQWQTHPRGAYSLTTDRIHFGHQSFLGASESLCAYKYDGYDKDKRIGVVECHHVAGYDWVIVPLVCLKKSMETLPQKLQRLKKSKGI
ncbi:MAG: hypothetical protein OXT67_00365 [Zetaproteobacteria bacterium]|nr:hypothetical protein [Zetaproteobacteria bacterium]